MVYSPEIETQMKKLYDSLAEKEQRRYAAIEAKKLGYGGISYIGRLFKCSRQTISQGLEELQQWEEERFNHPRIRREGGGRKKLLETWPGLDAAFKEVVEEHTAGDPMNEQVKWTYLTQEQIAQELEKKGFKVSVTVVKQLLKKHHYVKRKAQKKRQLGADQGAMSSLKISLASSKSFGKRVNQSLALIAKRRNMWVLCIERELSIQPKLWKPMTMTFPV